MQKFIALLFLATCVFAAPGDDRYSGRIVGGQTASKGQFPHQISLRIYGQHICGGSILTPTKILTAAHCIHGNEYPMTVVVGENKLSTVGQEHNVRSRVYHESYNPQSTINDIAMLTLATSISYNQNVQPVTLRTSAVRPGEVLTLSGWGQTSEPGSAPNDLQFMNMNAITLESCAAQLTGANPITTGHVCTQSPAGHGACMGDSGGPLVDANSYQIGVVSWGIPCAKGAPDVFTSVPFYIGWISNH